MNKHIHPKMIEDPEVKVSQPTFKACAQRATSPLS